MEQSIAQPPRVPQTWDPGSAWRRTEFTAQGKGVAENHFALFRDRGWSGSYSVLGNFWGVSPSYRYHGRAVCMVVQSCSLPLYQWPDSFLVHLPHQGLPESTPTCCYLQPSPSDVPQTPHWEVFLDISAVLPQEKIPENTPALSLNYFFELNTSHVLV